MKTAFLKNGNFIKVVLMAAVTLAVFLYANHSVAENSVGTDAFRLAFLLVSVVLFALLGLVFYLLMIRKTKLEYVFLLTGLTLGLCFSLLIPVRSAPDETIRMESAMDWAGKLTGAVTEEKNTSRIRVTERDNNLQETGIIHDYYNTYFGRLSEPEGDPALTEVVFNYTEEVPQILYVVPGFGIAVGRIFHLGTVPTFLLGRFMHLLVFLGAGFYAIRRMPFGKELLFLITLFPMTIQETATFSIDSLPLSMTFAVIAFSLHYAFSEQTLTEQWRKSPAKISTELVVIGLSVFLLAGCKYGALLPVSLLLLIPMIRKGRKDRPLFYGCLIVILLAVFLGFLPGIIQTFQSGVLLAPDGTARYTLHDILSDPLHTFTVLGNTINRYLDHYVYSTVGTSLGWFELNIPSFLGICFLLILTFSVLSQDQEKLSFTKPAKWVIGILAFLGIAFSVAGMFLGNTPRSSEVIEGVQGRYFLPFLLPLLTFAGAGAIRPADREGFQRTLVMWGLVTEFAVVMFLFIRAY